MTFLWCYIEWNKMVYNRAVRFVIVIMLDFWHCLNDDKQSPTHLVFACCWLLTFDIWQTRICDSTLPNSPSTFPLTVSLIVFIIQVIAGTFLRYGTVVLNVYFFLMFILPLYIACCCFSVVSLMAWRYFFEIK